MITMQAKGMDKRGHSQIFLPYHCSKKSHTQISVVQAQFECRKKRHGNETVNEYIVVGPSYSRGEYASTFLGGTFIGVVGDRLVSKFLQSYIILIYYLSRISLENFFESFYVTNSELGLCICSREVATL